MTTRLFTLLAAVAVLAVGTPAFAAPPAELPHELKLIPPDAAIFIHLDVAALYDGKLGDAVKSSKSKELAATLASFAKLTGGSLADLRTLTFAWPNLRDGIPFQKGMTVVTFRKKYDRDKVVAALKAQAKEVKGEFAEKENVVRVTTPSPFSTDNKQITITDLTDPTRIVTLQGIGDEFLKPSDVKGLHSESLKANASAAAIVGVNFNALPDEIRMENLPAQVRPFQPILHADGLSAVGTLTKDKLTVSVAVKSKNKGDAAEVEKSLDALRQLAEGTITAGRKEVEKSADKSKEIEKLLDVVQAALKEAKFAVDEKVTTASLALPLDVPYGPALELLVGGGLNSRSVSQNNMKQLALGIYNYESAHGFYPAPASLGKKGKKLLSWRVELLPYVEQEALYKQFNHDEPWDSEHNLKVFKDNPMPAVFAIPGTTNADDKKTHYQVFVGNGAMFDPAGPTKVRDIRDGTSNTLLIATAATAVEWTRPDDIEFGPKADLFKLLLFKDGVTQVAMGDGSVRALSEKISEKTLRATVTRDGGEVLGDDF